MTKSLSWDAIRTGSVPVATEATYHGSGRKGAMAIVGPGRALLSFRLATEIYALDILRIREIIRVGTSTEVPRAPAFVAGVISVRGTIVPIVDLRMRLRLHVGPTTKASRILIVTKDNDPYGLLVDEVRQVDRLGPDDIEPPPPVIGGVEAEFLAGIGRPPGRMLILIDLDAVLTFEVRR